MKKVLLFSIVLFAALTVGPTSKASGPGPIGVGIPDWGVQCWTPHPYLNGYCQHWYYVTQQGIANAVSRCESISGAYVGTITPL